MPKKKTTKNGRGKLTEKQERELAELPPPRTEFARRLLAHRREILAAGEPLVSLRELKRQLADSRAGRG
jgi:hypothetical protein